MRENRWFTSATDIVGSSTTGSEIGSGPTRSGVSLPVTVAVQYSAAPIAANDELSRFDGMNIPPVLGRRSSVNAR